MSACRASQQIATRGWAGAEFGLPEIDRSTYARAANLVIGIALANEAVNESLTFEVNPGLETGAVRTGLFGVGGARNSADKKVYLHAGFQSREIADDVLPERNQPSELRAFWDVHGAMLAEIETSTRRVLGKLGAQELGDIVFPADLFRRNVVLRTVRYSGALDELPSTEVVSGHADLGLLTWHLYETHGNWLHGAPYPPELIIAADSPERRAGVCAMRGAMRPLEQRDQTLPFFLGANWQTLPDIPEDLRGLPACYHAGFRPEPRQEQVSPFARDVVGYTNNRVSVVSFMHPNGDMLLHGRYVPATVSQCRPEYQT